ncbi:MAG: GNAT family N-acetyltransferase [Nocardia sp.]|nr:GNAT family N-acetyltransferase [Nocardia sp.]
MQTLTTPRLLLLPLSKPMIAARLAGDDFTLECDLLGEIAPVHFGPEWPGDILSSFPTLIHTLPEFGVVDRSYVIVDRAGREAIGQMGTKGCLDPDGGAEIGYGVNKSLWGAGYATEAVRALCTELLADPEITRITAETVADNVASQRVLEKIGFTRAGSGWTDDDGDLILWSLREN